MPFREEGTRLVDACKQHLVKTMRMLPECQPGGRGAGSKAIEDAAGFELHLEKQDNWFTWSLLQRMGRDGDIEIVPTGRARYRLKRPE